MQITVNVEDVVQEHIITIGNGKYDFSIGEDGLVVDHRISNTASMIMQFSVDNGKATNYISNDGTIKVMVTLSESTNTTFLSYCGTKPTSEISSTIIWNNTSSNASSIINSVTFAVSDSTQTSVSLIYTITDKVTGSVSEIGSKFYSNLPAFSFSVLLEDIVR